MARLELRLRDADEAATVAAALAPENTSYCRVQQDGNVLVIEVDEAPIGSVQTSVDDVLACVSAITRAEEATKA